MRIHRSLAAALLVAFSLIDPTMAPAAEAAPQNENSQSTDTDARTASTKKVPKGTVFAKDYPDAWPWPAYESGRLRCYNRTFKNVRRPIVLIKLGGKTYGLNGTAIGAAGYRDSRELMGRDQFGAYAGNSALFIQMGLELCKK
nr:hypothetical protein [uncultured Hyphomonas sp.]